MAQEHQYFYEDEIYRFNKKGKVELGMVLENAEFCSSDEESDEAELEDRVAKGRIKVAWYPKGEEEVVQDRKVGLADRSLMPGDVVRRLIPGKDTQRGYCRQVNVSSCVQIVGTKLIITSIDGKDLLPLEEFTTDIAVALDSWVGMVTMVKCLVHLATADGSKCVMSDDEVQELDDMRDNRDSEFHRFDFYPGQQLCGSVRAFENARWLNKSRDLEQQLTKPHKLLPVSVIKVQVVELGVRWQCRAFCDDPNGDAKDQPKYSVTGDDLKRVRMLNVFEPCTLQLGDRNYYVVRETDLILPKDQWVKSVTSQFKSEAGNPSPLKPRPLHKSRVGDLRVNGFVNSCDDSDGFVDVDTDECSDTASVSSSNSCGSVGHKNQKCRTLMTKMMQKRKLKRSKQKSVTGEVKTFVKPGDKLVVETTMTVSKASVVWQDGTIEENISSTVLYPIHHLDDQEFFPGDFVVMQTADLTDSQQYGVVQKVDHAGRTSLVRWFRTYTTGHEPRPQLLSEEEVSVYDLRDHPDFRYRPGSVVIRVANFEPDQVSAAGQVLDNFPSGEVNVWWVNGSTSVCFPQDLYKVGEYDSDDGELWDDTASDESWETESEHSVVADEPEPEPEVTMKTRLLANIEKARIAMSRLEEIFTQNPALQTTSVMKQLLDVYKESRYMDKLLGTTFFSEGNFCGLIEKVRERGRASTNQRMTEQFNRLFSISDNMGKETELNLEKKENGDEDAQENGIYNEDVDLNGKKENGISVNLNVNSFNKKGSNMDAMTLSQNWTNLVMSGKNARTVSEGCSWEVAIPGCQGEIGAEILSMVSDNSKHDVASGTDSEGNMSARVDVRTSHMCAQLCTLMKVQLLKTYEEVVSRFGGHFDMSLILEFHEGDDLPFAQFLLKGDQQEGEDEEVFIDAQEDKDMEFCEGLLNNQNEVAGSMTGQETMKENLKDSATGVAEGFQVLTSAPDSHKFKLTMFQPNDPATFYRTVRKEMQLLQTSLPPGIWVKGYEDRMDLYSVMIRGPQRTPYEDGLFFFDFQLSADYPRAPPLCHYISYCSERLNPNLYEEGKVCISLLGTWNGKGTEVWTNQSNLLQVIVSIQGLILVNEPYFNEAGYERQKGSQQGLENSRMYNEMVLLKLIQSTAKVLQSPPDIFRDEVFTHYRNTAALFLNRLQYWLLISDRHNANHSTSLISMNDVQDDCCCKGTRFSPLPEYPLIPASKGFCITLHKTLQHLRSVLTSAALPTGPEVGQEHSALTDRAELGLL